MIITGAIADKSFKEIGKIGMELGNHKTPRTWIMLADSKAMKLFFKAPKKLEFLGEATQDPAAHAEMSNQSVGRVVSSGGGGTVHHKFEPRMEESRQDTLAFVRSIAAWLDKAANENAFDRLVLAAAPRTLGDLRKVMGKQVQDRIVAEVSKELLKANEKKIMTELEDIQWG